MSIECGDVDGKATVTGVTYDAAVTVAAAMATATGVLVTMTMAAARR